MNPLNNSRGQVAVLYALLIPIFLFMGGVGLDLGWYYLNVSRLQNAADASVLAGADKLIETNTDAFKGYKVKLVDKYPADNHANTMKSTSTINMTAGNAVALEYAKKNLEDNSTAYAPPNLFSVAQAADDDPIKDGYTRGDNTVNMTTGLYQDGEDYYYVVGLSEDIHHFFIGFLDDMNAGVVAVALISKNINDDDDNNGGTTITEDKELVFDGNGGTFSSEKPTSKEKVPSPDSMEEDETITLKPDDGLPTREGYTFNGWNTNQSGSGNHYNTNQELTAEELEELLDGGGKLFAEWIEDASTEDTQDLVEEGLSIFGAMKGYKDPKGESIRKGLEELMTYRTWMTIYNKGIDPDSTVAFATSTTYNSDGYRQETAKITPRTNDYGWTAFFDLGSDLTYEDYHPGNLTLGDGTTKARWGSGDNSWGGLFKRSFDSSDIQSDKVTIANYLKDATKDIVNSYNGVSCLSGTYWPPNTNSPSSARDTYKLFLNHGGTRYAEDTTGFNYLKYRVHTSFNINQAWPVRSNKTVSDSYKNSYTDRGETVPAVPDSDPLYVRIESEELNEGTRDRQNTTVRQMFINVNASNLPTTTTKKIPKSDESDDYKEVTIGSASGTKYLAQVGYSRSAPLTANRVYVNGEYSFKRTGWFSTTYYYTISGDKYSDYTDGGDGYYYVTETNNLRPMVIFYEGPDRGLTESYDEAELSGGQTSNPKAAYPNLTIRDSQPVVLNLQADFRGILFAPNSPVIIKGNGHKMEGFVVAKKFVDFADSGHKQITENGLTFYIDKWGNIQTKDLDYNVVRRRPVEGELPYNAKNFEEYKTKYSYTFNAYKAANFEAEE